MSGLDGQAVLDWMFPLRFLAVAHLQAGDVEEFRRSAGQHAEAAAAVRSPFETAMSMMLQAMDALASGRFGEAIALRDAAAIEGLGDDAWNIETAYAGNLLATERDLGNLAALLPLVQAAAEDREQIPAFRAALAAIAAEAGEVELARITLAEFSAEKFENVPRDTAWPISMAFLAEAVVRLGDREAAADLLPLFAPFAGEFSVTQWGVVCLGAVDRSRATLAVVLGDLESADRWFADALALEERAGAVVGAVRTRLWWGRSFHGRDDARAAELLGQARDKAAELGMKAVIAEADALLSQIQ